MNKFHPDTAPYLEGKRFSNGLNVSLRETLDFDGSVMRLDFLQKIANKKNIIHLGFADHLPLIRAKIEKNNWLHKRLCESANICWGVDIDIEVIEFVSNNLGYKDVVRLDVVNEDVPDLFNQSRWDYMIIGEVLEHIDNPVQFLSAIYKKYKGIVDKVVITVPNAHDLLNIRNVFKNVECINTDHRYWFTPYTLAKVGVRSGFQVNSFTYCQSYMPGNFIYRSLIKKYQMLRESVVMIFDLK